MMVLMSLDEEGINYLRKERCWEEKKCIRIVLTLDFAMMRWIVVQIGSKEG